MTTKNRALTELREAAFVYRREVNLWLGEDLELRSWNRLCEAGDRLREALIFAGTPEEEIDK